MSYYNYGDIVQIINGIGKFENEKFRVIIHNDSDKCATICCVSLDNKKIYTINKRLLKLDIIFNRKQKLKRLKQ